MKKLIKLFKSLVFKISQHKSERLYYWTALSHLGETKFGHVYAKNRHFAKQQLRNQTLIVKTITHTYSWARPLKPKSITQFLQHLLTLLQTEISLRHALQLLSTCQMHSTLFSIVLKIQTDLESGLTFAESLQQHPKWFDGMVCHLIALGEHSGTLVTLLEKIVTHQSKKLAFKRQLLMILLYPITIIGVACIVSIHVLLTIIPQFQTLFQNVHAPLPRATIIFLDLAQWLKNHGYLLILVSGFVLISTIFTYRYVLSFRLLCDRSLLKIPWIGALCRSSYLARSFYALSMTQQAGLSLVDALQWVAPIAGNLSYQHAFLHIHAALKQGESIKSAAYRTALFPELTLQMFGLGEESGTLHTLLNDLSHYYSQQVEYAVQWLNRCIEPALMILLGLLIGGLVLAMYLPIIKLGALI